MDLKIELDSEVTDMLYRIEAKLDVLASANGTGAVCKAFYDIGFARDTPGDAYNNLWQTARNYREDFK
jgi:hypothetical protein